MADQNYYYVKWSGYAEIEGTRVDILSFEITYELNEIPTATFFPVVGRDAQTGEEAEGIDALINAKPYTPIKIYMTGETELDSPQAPDEPGFPYGEDTLVFDGVFQGVRYRSTRQLGTGKGVVGLAASASGWLVGLVGTSANNTKTTVKGAGGFAEAANLGIDGNPLLSAIFNITTAVSSNVNNAVDDLWKSFIKPLFLSIANNETVWGDTENDSALEALNRMDDEEQFGSDAELLLTFGEIRGDVPKETVGEWLLTTLVANLYYQWRTKSIWDALKAAANEFTFQIVPLIDTATCAPVFGALGGDAYIIVAPDEYHDINITFRTPQLITKVVVTSGNVGQVSPWADGPRYSAVIGQASADDVTPLAYEGATISVQAPHWLAAEPTIGKLTKVGLGKDEFGIPDGTNPEFQQYTPQDDENYTRIYNSFITSEMGNAYARLKLLNVMLKARTGSLTGRFRLDIAPGSTIAVEVIGGGKFSDSQEPRYIYGLVQSVVLKMDGGAGGTGNASTTLFLRNVMTAQEHDGYLGILTEEKHPVFQARYGGAKLTGE